MWPFHQKETRSDSNINMVFNSMIDDTVIDAAKAMQIPTVKACVKFIAGIINSSPIKLFKLVDNTVEEVSDNRTNLLNDDTGDLLNAVQMKEVFIKDYLLKGNGYIFINRQGNKIESLHYVNSNNVTIINDVEPIFKRTEILINGKKYYDFDFIKLTQNSTNGVSGAGIINTSSEILKVVYDSLVYENALVKSGGAEKGFLKSTKVLTQDAKDKIKEAWRKMFTDTDDNVIVLDAGMEFQSASLSSTEMQLNENKVINSAEICKLFCVPPNVLAGTASVDEYNNFIKSTIIPIYSALVCELNKMLLLESEKDSYYFAFDPKELLKSDMEKLFNAYRVAINANFMQIDEVRYELDLKPLGFNRMKLNLADVLLDPVSGEIYTPNTGTKANINGRSEIDESRS
ncbi:MAG: phage portal protein [Epulopiscium sp. Nuni2H_MBin001]|nr:MAG: phage portal protein [Epulopiscium sp. Nuni2H_MBin001]